MAELVAEDIKKLYYAIRCINKTLHCTLCHKLPPETRAANCGHPFCKNCIEKLLESKKAACNNCKKAITRGAVRPIESLDKVKADLDLLNEAIDKDLDALCGEKPDEQKQYPGKRDKLSLPGPTTSFNKIIVQDASSESDSDTKLHEKTEKRSDKKNNSERRIIAQKIDRKTSIDSEETIKIKGKESKLTKKGEEVPFFAEPSVSKVTNPISEPVFTTDNLSNKIKAIGCQEKVQDWLNSEEFEEESKELEELSDIEKPQDSSSPSLSELLESFSQMKQKYSTESMKSDRTSRASQTPKKTERERSVINDDNNEKKFKSFTFEATNKRKKSVSNALTPEDILFDELRKQTVDDELESKKLKANSVLTESSWCELEKFKKESNPKVRKRRRLNVSIERPKPVAESFEFVGLEEEEGKKEKTMDTYTSENRSNRQSESKEETNEAVKSVKERKKNFIISNRSLERNEMIDVSKLNMSMRQVIEIIGGPDTNASKNSTNSPEKSASKLNESKLSPRRSAERHSREKKVGEGEEESSPNIKEQSRPRSRQGIHPTADDCRPNSRLSSKSPDKSAPEKFKLSIGRKSTTPQPNKDKDEEIEEIVLKKDSPVRVSNNIIRNKLSLKRLSSGSSRMTDADSRSSVVVFQKFGKLHKLKNRIRFVLRGSTRTKTQREELQMVTRNVGIQTSPELKNVNLNSNNSNNKNYLSSQSMPPVIIPETRTVSTVSSNLKQIEEAPITDVASTSSHAVTRGNSWREFDAVNKANLLSPEKDSQLKFLATKSPSVPRIDRVDSDKLVETIDKSYKSMEGGETSFKKSARETFESEEYSRAIEIRGQKLIVTDSEDQDTPNEIFWKSKRKNNHESSPKKRISSVATSTGSKTMSNLSEMNEINDKIKSNGRDEDIFIDQSSPIKSVGNNDSGKRLSRGSPKRNKYSRESFGSESKRRSAEKLKLSVNKTSESQCNKSSESDAETVLLRRSKNENQDDQPRHLEDSEASIVNGRHKVVRKLKYSQESGKSSSEKETVSDNKEKKPNNHGAGEKKTFQRIRKLSSSESENDVLVISLTTKQSSSNSQTIEKPVVSREMNKSPIASEDMSVVFSASNKDTQESKRKRSPSPNPLDNNELQAIASNWCADLETSSEEILLTNQKVVKHKDIYLSSTPSKKPRVELQSSRASLDSDDLPILSPSLLHGPQRKVNDRVETAAKINSQSLNNEESTLIDDLDAAARQFDDIDKKIHQPKNSASSFNFRNDKELASSAEHEEYSIERANTIPTMFPGRKHSAPIEAKALGDKKLATIRRSLQNSDKEDEIQNQRAKRRGNSKEPSASTERSTSAHDDLEKLKGIEEENVGRLNSSNNSEVFESSFNTNYFNITKEEILLQEIGDNLLERKSKKKNNDKETIQDEKTAKKTQKSVKDPEIDNANQKTRGYQIVQIEAEDYDTTDEEDIIESTPDKNSAMKNDLVARAGNSQRSNASLKSFMSINMTPIPKVSDNKNTQLGSNVSSPIEPGSKSLMNSLKNSYHSTPKAASTLSSFSTTNRSAVLGKCVSVLPNPAKRERLCFVCSCLPLAQVEMVKTFARKHNVEYTAIYKPEVTHVIVETNEKNSAARTLKFLLGVTHKNWIVSYQWVIDSMNHNQILNEEKYETVDSDTEEPGPRRSRLSKHGLFDDFAFVCMKPFADIKVEELQDLLSNTGGTVVQTLEELAAIRDKHKVILYSSDIHETAVLDKWLQRGKAMPIIVDWALSSISQYNLISFRYYLQLDPNILSDFNYPECLIAEDDEEECVMDAST